jgi:hypothetical protein
LQQKGIDAHQVLAQGGVETPITDGLVFSAPEGHYPYGDCLYYHPGGGCTFSVRDKLVQLLETFINRFLGADVRMMEANQVEAKLLEAYRPVKAARLVSLWLYVQRFGSDRAKATFGPRTYYYARADLKRLGISLAGGEHLTTQVDKEFLQSFALTVPSIHAVNRIDDFRGSENVLNFVPKTSGRI